MSIRSIYVPLSMLCLGASLVGCASVPTGRVGVEWTPMRGTVQRPLTEGYHVISPFARVYDVDLREQQSEDSLDVLANNGLDIKLRSSILYQPVASEAYALITQTGANYYPTLDCTVRHFERAKGSRSLRARRDLFLQTRTD
jgi:hypothetical protein